MATICGDNRFEIISKAKEALLESTNIEESPKEMAVLDDILFRCWQMGWLDKYGDKKADGWIPVSERLPDELVAVNVTWINRCPQNYYMHIKDKPFTDTAVLYRGEWYWWDNTIIDYLSEYGAYVFETVDKSIDILAWMALPEPWKGGSRNDNRL